MSRKAFVLRIAPGDTDRVPDALKDDALIIGWSRAEGLLEPGIDWNQFRSRVHREYHSNEKNFRRSGGAAGHLWRFLNEMEINDLVVVPYGSQFYVAEVAGPPYFDARKIMEDTAHRRPARWLNGKAPIARTVARSALLSRMPASSSTLDRSR
jgi:predicted Mrr-cat superfamily restriction endonuclease